MTLRNTIRAFAHRSITKSIVAFGHIAPTAKNIVASAYYHLENETRMSPPDDVMARYGDDSLGGYATLDRSEAVNEITEPRFALVQNVLDARLTNTSGLTVVEIGTAGGALIGTLASAYPQHRFIGTDFSIKRAHEQFAGPSNLLFEKGYHLNIRDSWRGDILLMISTATCLLPMEIDETFRQAKENGFKTIILSEPWWWHHKIDKNSSSARSVHMKYVCWGHDYPGYLAKHGYKTKIADLSGSGKEEVARLLIVADA